MTRYEVQFTLPVNNPENFVRITRCSTCVTFEVPLNYPDIHKMGYADLVAAAELTGLVGLSTHLNKKSTGYSERISKAKRKMDFLGKPVDITERKP